MTDADLLKRIEQQAVEIDQLKEQVIVRDRTIARLEQLTKELPNMIYRQMAESAVNCGQYSGCSLARRMVDDKA